MSQPESLTKIIATMGPACTNKETLKKMFKEGLDVCRLNFSHGSHEDHKKVMDLIREINKEMGIHIAILVDLQGPKLRIGDVENNGVEIEAGKTIQFSSNKCLGTAEKVYMSYTSLPQDVKKGEIVLVDDGKLQLEVLDTNKVDTVTLKILNGGILSSKKGVNLPNTKISLPSLTKKDLKDLHFALEQDIDFIALSFVRTAKDIIEIKKIIAKAKKEIRVIAKIEKPEAVDNFDEIVKVTDCVMVARGDLGVETPFDQVPVLQKELVQKCIKHAKPVIIATQMMESMITNFRPTRAEATDVANAVLDGADAVMLSGETSVGSYPLETIINMQKVITATEASGFYLSHDYRPNKNDPNFLHDTICFYACEMADHTEAAGILDFTFTGTSAVKIASYRPDCKIFAFGDDELVIRQLSLVRGVKAFSTQRHDNIHDATNYAFDILKSGKFVRSGDRLIIVGGIPLKNREHVNMVKVAVV